MKGLVAGVKCFYHYLCGKECTLQFQPSANMSWQSWACNVLNQAATYPSPYANVHKGKLCTMVAALVLTVICGSHM